MTTDKTVFCLVYTVSESGAHTFENLVAQDQNEMSEFLYFFDEFIRPTGKRRTNGIFSLDDMVQEAKDMIIWNMLDLYNHYNYKLEESK